MQSDLVDLPQVQQLFATPPDQFTSERDAVAKAFAVKGDAKRAEAVKALRKPPLSVWAVNQLARKHGKDIERLFDAADRLRSLQSRSAAGELARATHDVQSQIWNLVELTKPLLQAVGSIANTTIERRIQSTLQAAALQTGEDRENVRRGTLSKDLTPPAFTDLMSSLPPPARVGKAVLPAPDTKVGSQEMAEAEREMRAAQLHLEQLQQQVQMDETNLFRAREAAEQAERTVAALNERARALERELRASRSRAEEGAKRLATARKKLERLARSQTAD